MYYLLLPLLTTLPLALSLAIPNLPISSTLQNILSNTDNSPLYTYPTQITQDIIPKRIHSHNDYWRPLPFYSALSVGCISIEADVWLINSTLYVGHEEAALTTDRTLASLYIDPILDTLRRTNPSTPFTTHADPADWHGVYDASSSQTLYLFIDLKTPRPETWPFVVAALAPLREQGFLTTYNGTAGGITPGAVTVIGTGNTPASNFTDLSQPRDYFLDADLAELNGTQRNITSDVSPIASTSFLEHIGEIADAEQGLNETQLEVLRGMIEVASSRGIGARYWETPGWPVGVRNGVWRVMEREGVALLNADDLVAAAGFVGWTNGEW